MGVPSDGMIPCRCKGLCCSPPLRGKRWLSSSQNEQLPLKIHVYNLFHIHIDKILKSDYPCWQQVTRPAERRNDGE